jgi:hypothetical protein
MSSVARAGKNVDNEHGNITLSAKGKHNLIAHVWLDTTSI